MKIQFLGATGTVTGSRYLLSHGHTKILVDCGLFQGFKNLRLKNWSPFPVPPSDIDAVLLTHAHLDHSGYIPLLVKSGFRGHIYTTQATLDLCSILLPDSGYLQEEEAYFANKRGFSKHNPALPLYTHEDAHACLASFKAVPWKQTVKISEGEETEITCQFHPAGHLLGAASILVKAGDHSIVFSGDLGRKKDPLIRDPDFALGAKELVVESTYGNRKHSVRDPEEQLAEVILRTLQRQGILLIPSFAVGRAQTILYYILCLKRKGIIPNDLPIYLNSPMAAQANRAFEDNQDELKRDQINDISEIWKMVRVVGSAEESKALNQKTEPAIIIAASGMATGGRVLHHLKSVAPDPKNTILFVGFQAGGTRGDSILRGAEQVKIHGEYWPIRAEVVGMDTLSAHGDADEIMSWIAGFKQKPARIFVTHGEPEAADVLRRRISEKFGVTALVPEYQQEFELLT